MHTARPHPTLSVPAMVVLACAGCVSQTHTPYRGSRVPRTIPAASPSPRPRPPVGISAEAGEGTRTHATLRLYRPRPCGTSEMELGALAYVSRSPGPKPWVIVLPIWGSSTYPSQKIVRRMTAGREGAGTNVLWIQGRVGLVRYDVLERAASESAFLAEVARTAACIDATAEDVRSFIDWVMAQPATDSRRVGLVGFSTGGIVGSLVMGRDRRLAAGVFVMVGGHLDEILSYCKWDERKVREHAHKEFGWTSEQLRSVIAAPLSVVDPVLAAGTVNPADVLYIDSGYDGCIPESARDDLWNAMGQPERVTIGYDHKNSFLTMTFLGGNSTTDRIVDFLHRRLATGEPPTPLGGAVAPSADGP